MSGVFLSNTAWLEQNDKGMKKRSQLSQTLGEREEIGNPSLE